MSDHAPELPKRRRFLRHTAAGMIGWASVEASTVASSAPRPDMHTRLVAHQVSVIPHTFDPTLEEEKGV